MTDVEVDELVTPQELRAAAELFAAIWGTEADGTPISPDLLRAFAHTGNYVAGVRAGSTLLGASVGFLANGDGEPTLHSHITGVAPHAQRTGLGYLLKLHQREWALNHGLTVITWTFDPLLRRNAYFNLTKLGGEATGYHVNFYGEMTDRLNRGDESDRCEVTWDLTSERALAASTGSRRDFDLASLLGAGAVPILEDRGDGQPQTRPLRGAVRLCWIPDDAIGLRTIAPRVARGWRLALRDTLGASIADGFVASAMTRSGWYVLEQR